MLMRSASLWLSSLSARLGFTHSKKSQQLVFAILALSLFIFIANRLSTPVIERIKTSSPPSWRYGLNVDARPPSSGHPRAHQTSEYVDDIKAWWKPWIMEMERADPGVSSVELQHDAASHGPSNIQAPRTPPENLLDITEDDLTRLEQSHAQFRAFLDSYDQYDEDVAGLYRNRGVVIVGGLEYNGPALVSILMLRETGSKLPVELFFPRAADYEPTLCKTYLPMLNARCFILEDFLSDRESASLRKTLGYQLKLLAALFSSFQEVLLLDSDSMPLVDPSTLFDSDAFKATGMLTWPDFWESTESPDFYTIAGLPTFPNDLPATSSESGQVVIDKSRHLKTLLLATYYNVYGPNLYYTLQKQHAAGEGDATTFEAAAVVLDVSYHRVKTQLRTVGRFIGSELGTEFRGSAMVQFAPIPQDSGAEHTNWGALEKSASDRVAFLHANAPKLDAGVLVDDNRVDDGYMFNQAGEHIRLFGDLQSQMDLFGQDVEKKIWGALRKSACDLADFMRVWKDVGRESMCEMIEEHYNSLFPL